MQRFVILAVVSLVVLMNTRLVFSHDFRIICNVDAENLLSVEEYQEMGIDTVWFYSGFPVKITEKGETVWNSEKARQKIEAIFKHFEGTGISVIPLVDIFNETLPGKGQICRWSEQPKFRCFSSNTDELISRLRFFVQQMSKFKSFGGICLDDEPGVQAGGCVCERCKKLFKEKYGISPPSNNDFLNAKKGVVSESHPVLLWDRFQKDQMRRFYTKLAAGLKKEYPNLPVLTIPAAAYFSGKQLSIPDCRPEEFIKANRRVTLDPCHIRNFQLYVQFYMNNITPSGWKEKVADGFCLYFMPEGIPTFSNIPIYDAFPEMVRGRKAMSIPAFKRSILQTFSEGANGIVYFPGRSLTKEHVKSAIEIYSQFINPVCHRIERLYRVKGQVGILYSTTTRAFADIWHKNPIERYKHLHQCDAIAYYLFKKGIPFEMILEDEMRNWRALQGFDIIISAGVDFLTKRSARILSAYLKNGGKIIFDKDSSAKIPGALSVEFDTGSWYRAVTGGFQRPADMEFQAELLDNALSKYLNSSPPICQPTSRHLNLNYLTDGENIYLFVVNDSLSGAKVEGELLFNRKYSLYDVLEDKNIGVYNNLPISLELGGLKVLKLVFPE